MLLGLGPDGPVLGRRVAVTGLGAVTCCGVGADALWEGLIHPTASGPERRVSDDFDPAVWFGPKEVRQVDRFAQFSVAAADLALADAGPLEADPERSGVIFATGVVGLDTLCEQVLVHHERGARRVSPRLVPMMMANAGAAHISMRAGWRGPSETSSPPAPPGPTGWAPPPDWWPWAAATWPSVGARRPPSSRWPWPPSPT